jgi:PAS domain S-box-containing protein
MDAEAEMMRMSGKNPESKRLRIVLPVLSTVRLYSSRDARVKRPGYVEDASDAQFAWNAQGEIRYWSRAAHKLYGYSERQAVGQQVQRLLQVDWNQPFDSVLATLREQGRWDGELRHRARGGRMLVVESMIRRVNTGHGEMFVESTRNIGDPQLRSRSLNDVMFDIDDQITTFDRFWHFTYVNDAAAKYLDKSADELIGRSVWEMCPELVGTEFYEAMHRAATEQVVVKLMRHCGRSSRWLEQHIYPSASGVTLLAFELNSRSAPVEEDVAVEETSHVPIGRDDMVAIVAHELRGSLAPLGSGVEFLKRVEHDSEAVRNTVGMLERQTRHMLSLLDDLIDSHRLCLDEMKLQLAPSDVTPLVSAAVEDTRRMIESRGLTTEVIHADGPMIVALDAGRFEQIMRNLLNNAAKFTDAGGRITVRTSCEAGQAVIEIADTGVGIPAEELTHIFQMFKQLPQHQLRSARGLGIGLALVRTLVQLHGGSIAATSDGPGKGSRFTFRLPLHRA